MDIVNFVIEFVPETITLLLWLLFLSASGLIYYWLKNKNNQSHEVPESLIRDYQESMVGNHSASESDYHSNTKNASILRSGDLKNQMQVASVSSDQMDKLSHEILELKEMIKSRDKIIEQLEEKVPLESASPSGDSMEVDLLKNKNQELENKLKEYELLENDLDTLRDLRIENKELKNRLNIEDSSSSEYADVDEGHDVSGVNEEEDVFVASGAESEGGDVHFVEGSGEDNIEDENVIVENKDIDKESVDLSGDAKSFGKVKVKGGSLFGRESSSATSPSRSLGDSDIDDEIESIKNQKNEAGQKPLDNQTVDDVESELVNEPQVENMVEEAVDLGLGSPEPESDLSDVESEIETVLAEENLKEEALRSATAKDSEESVSREDTENTQMQEEKEASVSEGENIVELNPVEQPDHQNNKKKNSGPGSDKSAEELLDEFEKMLG